MINRIPPELFAQPPIRSEYSRRRRMPRKVIRLIALVLLIGVIGGLSAYWAFPPQDSVPPADIPTMKAEGPTKQRPDEPGGIDIPHQNETVFQQIDNSAPDKQATIEHLLPGPEKPVEPTTPSSLAFPSTDMNNSAVVAKQQAPTPQAAPVADVAKQEEILLATKPDTAPSPANSASPAMPAGTAKIVEKLAPPSNSAVTAAESATTQVLSETKASPQPNTEEIVSAAKAQVKTAAATNIPKEMFTGGVEKKFMVQLGSFPEQQVAQGELKKIQAKYSDTLGKVKLNLVQADLGAKGTYYRVQGGPISDAQARSICAKLWSQRAPCIVVRPK